MPGDQSNWVPPDPISNSEVKPFSAYDSVELPCKSRSSPGFNLKTPLGEILAGFLFLRSERTRTANGQRSTLNETKRSRSDYSKGAIILYDYRFILYDRSTKKRN